MNAFRRGALTYGGRRQLRYDRGMNAPPRAWKLFDEHPPVLTYTYSFGQGLANALALGANGGLVVISPPRGAGAHAFDGLTRYGEVRALVAPNAFHTLGLAEWKACFPEAEIYAPAQAIARVESQSGLSGIRPVGELAVADVEFIDMPYYRTGEVLLRIASGRGPAWYVTDVILNMRRLPPNPLAKLVFGLSRSGPGLRFNNIAPFFMVQDRKALRHWLAEEFRKAPPRWLIPAHGDIVDFAADSAAACDLLASV